jgi:hypothetical protein
MGNGAGSLVDYYKTHRFNPVLIQVEAPSVRADHFAKRRNLYERHLRLPLAWLRGASVLEFGPNSGESSLLPALCGSRLTLVEPNHQVLPRLQALFTESGVSGQIEGLHCTGIESFDAGGKQFDLVVAEGFLCTLVNREAMLRKIAGLVQPGCFGVISFNDRIGGLLEWLRRALLFQACRLAGITDAFGDACLTVAQKLYGDDFAKLSSSRPFQAWWKDTLVNPFYSSAHLWSFPEVLKILDEEGCEFYSTSPGWATGDHCTWYKKVPTKDERRARIDAEWRCRLPYFLSGLPMQTGEEEAPDQRLIEVVADLSSRLCDASRSLTTDLRLPEYPNPLDRYLQASPDRRIREFNDGLKACFGALHIARQDELIETYKKATVVRSLWGTAYHYLCFQRSPDEVVEGGIGRHEETGCRIVPEAPPTVRGWKVHWPMDAGGREAETKEVDVTLFVPCFNEEGNIVATLETIVAACRQVGCTYEIVVVDDGSKDRSPELVKEFQRTHSNVPVRLVKNADNQGLAHNYMDAAFLGRGKYYRIVCGDNVEPLETQVAILSRMGQADMVIPYPLKVENRSALRRALSWAYARLVNTVSGRSLHYWNGCALLKRYDVMRWNPNTRGFGFQAGLVSTLLNQGRTYCEVGCRYNERTTGKSRALTWKNLCSVLHVLLAIFLQSRLRKVKGRGL